MVTQNSGTSQPRQKSLAPGTRHRYHLTSKGGYVQAVVKEFDGMALMVVDLAHTTHAEIKDRCRNKARPHGPRFKGEVLVVKANVRTPIQLALHAYSDGKLQAEGSRIPTADQGRVNNIG